MGKISNLEPILNALSIVRTNINPGRGWSKWKVRYPAIEEAYFNLEYAIQKLKENKDG
tara:strand:- start:147 stop:320 length:174 start_codon:yes stop_codon:yes gene_type:complete